MFLKKRMVNGTYYWSLAESYREDGKVKQRIIENLGNTEKAYLLLLGRKGYEDYLNEVERYLQTRSPLIWFGGKSRLASQLISLFPKHKTYVEPFGGAGHVLAQKKRSPVEVYNDLDGEVVNFFLVVRECPERFYEAVKALPYARDLYERWRVLPLPVDPFDRAVRWFYLNRCGFPGSYKGNPGGWKYGKAFNYANTFQNSCDLIKPFAARLARVYIEAKDFRDIIAKYDSADTFFYIDPPYPGREFRYVGEFSEQDHLDLARILSGIKGKAMVSYDDNAFISWLYAGWKRVEIKSHAFSKVVNDGEVKPARMEVVLMNYDS